MGLVQKIFYYHLPSAWMFLLGGDRLRRRERAVSVQRATRDRTAWRGRRRSWRCCSALLTLVTGPLWARKAWGVWWQWDVRLTSSLMGWMVAVAYLLAAEVRRPGSDKLAAGLALFGMANVPFIYISVNFWRTIHPHDQSCRRCRCRWACRSGSASLAFLLLFVLLLRLRVRLEEQRARLDALYLALDE